MVKSCITLYFIQYHENSLRNKLFLSVYSILKMDLYFAALVKNHSQISTWDSLESVANKKTAYLEKKQLVKRFSIRKINFQLAKFNFKIMSF